MHAFAILRVRITARECGKVLLDSNQHSPVSSGVCVQATQNLLGRNAQTAYHYTIRPSLSII